MIDTQPEPPRRTIRIRFEIEGEYEVEVERARVWYGTDDPAEVLAEESKTDPASLVGYTSALSVLMELA